ncbi:MAG: hypothetical protein ACYDAN_02535 [Candidatus Limnocylindrales bacterium]
MSSPIEIHLELVSGLQIIGEVAEEDVLREQLGLAGQIAARPDATDRERALSIAAMAVAYRMERGEGFFGLTDREGRFWIVRADTIAAGAVRDPGDAAATRRPGFTRPRIDPV